jgi:hypothetical protein
MATTAWFAKAFASTEEVVHHTVWMTNSAMKDHLPKLGNDDLIEYHNAEAVKPPANSGYVRYHFSNLDRKVSDRCRSSRNSLRRLLIIGNMIWHDRLDPDDHDKSTEYRRFPRRRRIPIGSFHRSEMG